MYGLILVAGLIAVAGTSGLSSWQTLVLGAIGVLETALADWISLWIVVGVLALHGFLAYQRKGAPVHMRVIGAVSTAAFGVVIILAKALLHFE